MSQFTFWKGLADAIIGTILLTKPELIYHSSLSQKLSRLSGLRTANPHPWSEDAISAQTAVALMTIAVGLGHLRASRSRAALPAIVLINAAWAAGALATVVGAPKRATSTLLMTAINHVVFSAGIMWSGGVRVADVVGI